MLAMQYIFHLPADYDMDIIRKRISDNGSRLNGFPDLQAKLYLYASRDEADCPSQHNLYAPFYVWQKPEGMQSFLASDGFAALCQHFGRPEITLWLTDSDTDLPGLIRQKSIMMRIASLPLYQQQSSHLDSLLTAFNPQQWRHLEILSGTGDQQDNWQNFRVAYVAGPVNTDNSPSINNLCDSISRGKIN